MLHKKNWIDLLKLYTLFFFYFTEVKSSFLREDRPPRREFGDRDVERNRALGPRGGRGGRGGGRFNDGRGKREFDRQSGSDKTYVNQFNNEI